MLTLRLSTIPANDDDAGQAGAIALAEKLHARRIEVVIEGCRHMTGHPDINDTLRAEGEKQYAHAAMGLGATPASPVHSENSIRKKYSSCVMKQNYRHHFDRCLWYPDALGIFVADMFKSRCRLQAENLFLRHQLNVTLRRAPSRLRLRGRDRALIRVPGSGPRRRQLLWFEVTRHPTAEWLARQITEAFPWTSAPAYLLRDNDRAYGHVFTSRVRAMGIRDRPISPESPWQNGYAERLIGTLRRECLDQMVIFGETHLRRILSAYAAYYNQARTHLALQKDAPLHRAVQRSGAIVAIPILAGLHHQYVRI